ncbi:MAG: thioesterase family protein [Polyangiaceae bacterium]
MTDYPADLRDDTRVDPTPKIPGCYRSTLSSRWNYKHPSGGVLMSIALRAATAELARTGMTGLSLVSATAQFCQAVLAGELLSEVRILRIGKTAAQLRVSLSAQATPGVGLEVLATFVKPIDGPDVHGIEMPAVDLPDEAAILAARSDTPTWAFYRNIDSSLAIGAPIWKSDWSAGPAHMAFWYRYRVSQRDDSGIVDPLALPPLLDTIPPALVRKLGPAHERYIMPSLDLTVFFIEDATTDWLLVETFVERARAGYAIGSANLWASNGRLVARAAQSMTLRQRRLG